MAFWRSGNTEANQAGGPWFETENYQNCLIQRIHFLKILFLIVEYADFEGIDTCVFHVFVTSCYFGGVDEQLCIVSQVPASISVKGILFLGTMAWTFLNF